MNYGQVKEIADLLYSCKVGDVTFSAALRRITEIAEQHTESEVTKMQINMGQDCAKRGEILQEHYTTGDNLGFTETTCKIGAAETKYPKKY